MSHIQGPHTDDVISLALHPGKTIVATGEIGRKPKIILWDLETKEVLAVLEGFFQRGVSLLTFDNCKYTFANPSFLSLLLTHPTLGM